MRPGLQTIVAEVVGVGDNLALGFLRQDHPVFDAFALGIGFGLLQRLEGQFDLLARVTGRGVAHHRIDLARRGLVEFQHPKMGFRLAGLHGGFRGAVDLRRHGLIRLQDFAASAVAD